MTKKKKPFVSILHAPVEGELKELSVKNDLKMFQALVGGLIEPVPMRMSKAEWKRWSSTAARLGVPHIKTPLFIVNEEGAIRRPIRCRTSKMVSYTMLWCGMCPTNSTRNSGD